MIDIYSELKELERLETAISLASDPQSSDEVNAIGEAAGFHNALLDNPQLVIPDDFAIHLSQAMRRNILLGYAATVVNTAQMAVIIYAEQNDENSG